MKKSLLALAVSALAAASIASTAASAATVYDKDGTSLAVYGRVQSVFQSKHWSSTKDENSIKSSARLGLEGRTQLFEGVTGFGKAEWEAANGDNTPDGDDNFRARYLWVGLDFGQGGEVKIGKFEEAIKYAIGPTDIFEDAGCTGLAGNDDKRESVIQYKWSGYGVDAIVSYALAKNSLQVDGAYKVGETVDLDYSVSAALGYTSPDVGFGPIGVRLGYIYGSFADLKDHENNQFTVYSDDKDYFTGYGYDDYNQFAISAFWGSLARGPYVAGVYQQRKFGTQYIGGVLEEGLIGDMTVSGFEFIVAYTFDNGMQLATGYEYQKYKVDGENGGSVEAGTIPLMAMWRINPRFDVWAEARFDAGTDDDDDANEGFDNVVGTNYSENVYSMGMRYKF